MTFKIPQPGWVKLTSNPWFVGLDLAQRKAAILSHFAECEHGRRMSLLDTHNDRILQGRPALYFRDRFGVVEIGVDLENGDVEFVDRFIDGVWTMSRDGKSKFKHDQDEPLWWIGDLEALVSDLNTLSKRLSFANGTSLYARVGSLFEDFQKIAHEQWLFVRISQNELGEYYGEGPSGERLYSLYYEPPAAVTSGALVPSTGLELPTSAEALLAAALLREIQPANLKEWTNSRVLDRAKQAGLSGKQADVVWSIVRAAQPALARGGRPPGSKKKRISPPIK